MSMMRNGLVGVALALGLLAVADTSAPAVPFGPWTAPTTTAASSPAPIVTRAGTHGSGGRDFCFVLLRFYQRFLNKMTMARCPMTPSCSNYSVQAITRYGPVRGIMLTGDRLLHEASEKHEAPLVRIGDQYRYFDPLENNTFWWCK
jgi:uncharacterized protein